MTAVCHGSASQSPALRSGCHSAVRVAPVELCDLKRAETPLPLNGEVCVQVVELVMIHMPEFLTSPQSASMRERRERF